MQIRIDDEFKELLRPLDKDEYEGLEGDIIKNGCRTSIDVWDNIIIDGHNRYDICTKHNIDFKISEISFDSRDDAKIWIIDNQCNKRNITLFEKGEYKLKKKDILLQIGREKQKQTLGNYKWDNSESVLPFNGKTEESHNTQEKLAKELNCSKGLVSQIEIIVKDATKEQKQDLRKGKKSIGKVYNEIRKEEKKQEKESEIKEATKKVERISITDRYEIYNDDFINVNKKIDLIVTDPPYPREYLNEWDKLGQYAKKNLKDNGFLVAYSGQLNLPDVLSILTKYLDYYWSFALLHNGNNQLINPRNIFCGWKPIIIMQKVIKKIDVPIEDIIQGTGRSKDLHEWQQSTGEVDNLINCFSMPGDVVCDPFMGSGTFILDAIRLNRFALGFEIKADVFMKTKDRINEAIELYK